jgi:dTDP-4-amino-4,6-dideoxygalactose transaminase
LALLGLGIGPGDEVMLPSYVCVAPLHAIEYVGATARLADIDPHTFNMDPADVRRRLTRSTRAIIVPHMFGRPADLDNLMAIGLPIVEDCAQALGASLAGHPAGSMGHIAVLSFYATKLLTTGEGGMVLSRDRRVLSRIRDLRDYDERTVHRTRHNYKLTDMQAALGRSQFRRLPAMLRRRRTIAREYCRRWNDLPLRLPTENARTTHAFHRFVISLQASPTAAARTLAALGVTARRPIFRPIHTTLGLDGYLGSTEAYRRALSIPIYPTLTAQQEQRIVVAVRKVFS